MELPPQMPPYAVTGISLLPSVQLGPAGIGQVEAWAAHEGQKGASTSSRWVRGLRPSTSLRQEQVAIVPLSHGEYPQAQSFRVAVLGRRQHHQT